MAYEGQAAILLEAAARRSLRRDRAARSGRAGPVASATPATRRTCRPCSRWTRSLRGVLDDLRAGRSARSDRRPLPSLAGRRHRRSGRGLGPATRDGHRGPRGRRLPEPAAAGTCWWPASRPPACDRWFTGPSPPTTAGCASARPRSPPPSWIAHRHRRRREPSVAAAVRSGVRAPRPPHHLGTRRSSPLLRRGDRRTDGQSTASVGPPSTICPSRSSEAARTWCRRRGVRRSGAQGRACGG